MRVFGPRKSIEASKGFYIVAAPPKKRPVSVRAVSAFGLLLLVSNMFTYSLMGSRSTEMSITESTSLYLLEDARRFIFDIDGFEAKVRTVGERLDIPPEWLMAVMYSESKFNPSVENFKGSGAVGLIQFMVPTVKELNVRMGTRLYMKDIQNMPAVQQLDLVEEYFQTIRERYGEYETLTDLYLAVLYPKARDQDYCFALYAKPSRAYQQNSGLDENNDGQVTVSDIDRRLKRLFPTAYMTEK